MAVTAQMVKELRERTGAGVLDCKRVLEQTSGDMNKAAEILRERGLAAAAKKTERVAADGRVEAYLHTGNRLGTLVEISCETDFVARTEEFRELSYNIAMQIAAASPVYVSREKVPPEVIEEEKNRYRAQAEDEGKPEAAMERIIEGRLAKFYQDNCLLEQPFFKDEDKTIEQMIVEAIAKLGENIVVRRFARFQVG